jgi:hypothetical protein
MRGSVIEVVVYLLNIFAVVSLWACHPKKPLFETFVLAIPQSQRKTESSAFVADTTETVFAPPICPALCHLVRKVTPGVTIFTVILSNGTPLPLREVRSPESPFCTSATLFDSFQRNSSF